MCHLQPSWENYKHYEIYPLWITTTQNSTQGETCFFGHTQTYIKGVGLGLRGLVLNCTVVFKLSYHLLGNMLINFFCEKLYEMSLKPQQAVASLKQGVNS